MSNTNKQASETFLILPGSIRVLRNSSMSRRNGSLMVMGAPGELGSLSQWVTFDDGFCCKVWPEEVGEEPTERALREARR